MQYATYDQDSDTISDPRSPRDVEIKTSDGTRLGRPDSGWRPGQLALCGLYPIARPTRPADTDTTTHMRTVELGTPGDPTTATEVWTARDFTEQELADQATAAETAADQNTIRDLLVELADGLGLDTTADLKAALQVLAREAVRDTP